MNQIIKAAVDRGASDLHIKAGDAFRARIHGKLIPLTKQALTPDQTRTIALHLMSVEEDKAKIDKLQDYDCSWFAEGIGRFRVNIMRQRGSFMIVMRVIPLEVPTFEKLQLPSIMGKIASAERGMILVTGVTGSGKSSTMAAMINFMNKNSNRHILTLENPIEFLHKDINCAITQREIGSDTSDFKQGLKSALRQDPDVIMIGEMRDAETIDTAMKAAETGHLLISTLHTADALSTINRVVAMFAPAEQAVVRIRLGESLHSVISQRLIKRVDGTGRAVAAEVLLNTPATKDMIIDGGRISEIKDYMEENKAQYGMQSFDQALTDLVISKQISFHSAMAAATKPADFELKLRMFGGEAAANIIEHDAPEGTETVAAAPAPAAGTPSSGLDFITQ
ncbi:MAG: PilT/PilU family type 4a pilus ATPase [Gemmatimonadota bacterium]